MGDGRAEEPAQPALRGHGGGSRAVSGFVRVLRQPVFVRRAVRHWNAVWVVYTGGVYVVLLAPDVPTQAQGTGIVPLH